MQDNLILPSTRNSSSDSVRMFGHDPASAMIAYEDKEAARVAGMTRAGEAAPLLDQHAGEGEWVHPEQQAGILSKITFRYMHAWLGGLLKQGAAVPLRAEHLWTLQESDETSHVATALALALENDRRAGRPLSLWRAIYNAFGTNMLIAGVCKLFGDAFGFVGPICINELIKYVEDPSSARFYPEYYGYIISGVLFAASILQTLCLHQHHHLVIREAIRVRSALTMLVFGKSLALSTQCKSELGSGRILNLATIDANKILDLFYMVHYSWAAPLQLVVGLLLLMRVLGVASLAGIALMVFLLPVSAFCSSQAAGIAKLLLSCTDARLKVLNELFQHIRVVKLYAWERELLSLVESVRFRELRLLKRMLVWNAISQVALQAGPVLVSLASFGVYAYVHQRQDDNEPLTPDRAFTALALFSIFRLPLGMLPRIFALIFQANVSIKRLEAFAAINENDSSVEQSTPPAAALASPFIGIRNATFTWSRGEENGSDNAQAKSKAHEKESKAEAPVSQLANVSVTIPKGQLTLVVGAVGSGKSTLLSALLGELQPDADSSGRVFLPSSRRTAYAAQSPYLVNASVKDNIVFGSFYDRERLERVVESCELPADLKQFAHGLETEVGENGVTLSGGQKQRISIARTVYAKNQELYVFDDALSALDAHVASRIFDQCFNESTKGMLAGHTRVLSTHALQFAKYAQWIIVMDQMRVVQMGTFHDLTVGNPEGKFAQLLHSLQQPSAEKKDDAMAAAQEEKNEDVSSTDNAINARRRTSSRRLEEEPLVLMEVETKVEGTIALRVYFQYIAACGVVLSVGALSLLFATQVSSLSTDLWLTKWTGSATSSASEEDSSSSLTFYLSIYAYLSFSTIALGFCGDLTCRFAGLSASKSIHYKLLRHMIKGTMRFFNTTPVGRILNRFSNDMNTIGTNLPIVFYSSFLSDGFALFHFVHARRSKTQQFDCCADDHAAVAAEHARGATFYAKSCRELQRLDNISKSPIYAHFTQTLNGLATIRAFKMVATSQHDQATRINGNTKAFLSLNLINRWLGVRLEFLGALITFAVAFFVSRDHLVISSAMAGLLLSYSQTMTSLLNWIVRNNIDMENMMNSVERTEEYCHVDTEPLILDDDRDEELTTRSQLLQTRPKWPEQGNIVFSNVLVKYHPQARPVLHGVSFSIRGGEKVGICGRTGAGKSSLLLALFRLLPCADGHIQIDGVNIADLDLHDLRARMAIIPQDPVLFAASIRFNLDPTGTASDAALWHALRKSHLHAFVSRLPDQLEALVLEGGDNFSVGERQLLCLARAILRESTILCLDEATASMDHTTDALIQKSIRTEFAESTVLTIAHRVETILDYDKILVLKHGRVAEFGTPDDLRRKPNGEFAGMLEKP
ncbi:Atp-binding protein, partial [Globisporangium splendens]